MYIFIILDKTIQYNQYPITITYTSQTTQVPILCRPIRAQEKSPFEISYCRTYRIIIIYELCWCMQCMTLMLIRKKFRLFRT